MEDYFKSPIFVLGMPRSGTSMVAGALNICGAWTGSTVPADSASNPKGFFEHTILREHVTKKILTNIGCDPLGVRKIPPMELPGEVPGLKDLTRQIIESDGYINDRPWLYKDAKLTFLWPYFLKAFPDATWLIVNRDEEGFVNSCLRTHFMKQHSNDRSFWEQYAEQYRIRLEALKMQNVRVLEIYTPDVIDGNFESLKNAVSQLDLSYKENELREFISPVHWHGGTCEDVAEV